MRVSPIQPNLYSQSYRSGVVNYKGNKGKILGTVVGGAVGAAVTALGTVALGPLGLFMGAALVSSGAGSGAIGGMLYDQMKDAENDPKNPAH